MSTEPASVELIFGKYEILSRLAVGGMGEVFYAVQRGVQGFERPAILKNLLPDLAQQDGFIEQFLDEARVAATLNHPNVVSIYEVGLWNGTYFIAMEYIQGRNVSQLIKGALKNHTPMPPLVAANVIRDAALGLHHAHVAKDARGEPLGIVHRDISPQNIMVRDDGVTKVVDFGIARAANRATRTQTGTVKGKLSYMPPEQVLSSAEISGKADQYSLGVVLWEMCAGRRLFKADHDVALMKMVLESRVPRLTDVAPSVPSALADVVERMVSREHSARFPTCAHAAKELDLVLSQFGALSDESPVSMFLRTLGPWDLPTPQSTPTGPKKNFVISLGGDRESRSFSPAPPPPPLEPAGVEVDLSPTGVIDTGSSHRISRRSLPLVMAGVLALLVGSGVTWRVLRGGEPVEVAPPPVVVVPPPVEVPPEVVLTPTPTPNDVKPELATWSLKTTPSGATARLDGRPMGQTPLELTVSGGETHFLLLERAGHKRDERELPALKAGEARELEVSLTALRTATPTPVVTVATTSTPAVEKGPGFLTLSTKPWTKVSSGRELLGSTPLFKVKLSPGEHTLTLVNEGQNVNVTRRVTIRPGEVTKLDLQL